MRGAKKPLPYGRGSVSGLCNVRRASALVAAVGCFLLIQCGSVSPGEAPKVRPAAVAGSFYPSDAKELAQMVDGFLARAEAPSLEAAALVAPHAGYPYSGQVAANAYATLKGRKIDRVVLIAPSHYEAFGYASVYDGSAYATPLGEVPVDRAFAAKLASQNRLIRLSSTGHAPAPDRLEHSVEIQLPFLQRTLGQFQLVPIVMGDQSYEVCRALGLALAKLLPGTNTLIVASSDLSHYHPYEEGAKMDRRTLKAVEEWDYLSMSRNFDQRIWEACGGGPVVAAMIASERLGASRARVLKYANSGDVTGDKSRVVGYGAVAFVKTGAGRLSSEQPFALSGGDKAELLRIARRSVEASVKDGKTYEPPAPRSEALAQERGAFVTLKESGDLRGCIGYVAPIKPLYLAVRDVARFAALEDSRFRPVGARELPVLEYEISVLSPMRRVLDPKEVTVGRDGLLIRQGRFEGLLLPQVPVEQRWDRGQFLDQVCMKASLPQGTWKSADADLFRFTALVFGEVRTPEPPGSIPLPEARF